MQVMKKVVPPAGKVAKEARECVQERYPIKNEKSKFLGHNNKIPKIVCSVFCMPLMKMLCYPTVSFFVGTS